MIVLGVGGYKAKTLSTAVKIFGKSRYNKSDKYIIKCIENNIEIPDMDKL